MSYPENHGKPWTVEQMLDLGELYLQPITWRSIAEKMKRTIPACQFRLTIMRITCELNAGGSVRKTLKKMEGKKVRHKKE